MPDLPAVDTPGTLAPAVNCRPKSPSTAGCIASWIARVVGAASTRRHTEGSIVRAPGPVARQRRDEVRRHQHAVVRDGRRHERHLERASRTSRPARTRPTRAPTSSDEPARGAAVAASHLADTAVGRSNGIGAPKPELGGLVDEPLAAGLQPREGVPDVAADLGRADRSSAVSPVIGWWPSRIRKPSTRRPVLLRRGLLRERGRRA